jgi:hypothetical protein
MRIPVRDCMTEGRMTTHGWVACTSVEGTRAPSTGDTIERTRDSTRPPRENSSLGQKPGYRLLHLWIRGVRIFDSANSNFEKVEIFDSNSNSANSNSNWQIGIRFARIVVVQNSFMNNSKALSNIRE